MDKMPVEAKPSAIFVKKEADASSMAPAPAAAEEASASGVNSGPEVRLPAADEVKLILSLRREDLSIAYLDDLARRLQHEEDVAPLCKRVNDEFQVYRNEVRKKINAWTKEQWAASKKEIRESGLVFCAREADQATQGYIEYVDSEDDDGSECDDDSEDEDED